MPVLVINGDKKKVACGPCIRGHRSSKCTHKDRVLIEVRKPGRPLGTCPHPATSCSCERVVINYMIPKAEPVIAKPFSPSTIGAPAKIVKQCQRSIGNFSQNTIQKVISGELSNIVALGNIPSNLSVPSETSSQPSSTASTASTASSTSSTPRINALQSSLLASVPDDKSMFSIVHSDWKISDDNFCPPTTTNFASTNLPSGDSATCCCAGSAQSGNSSGLERQTEWTSEPYGHMPNWTASHAQQQVYPTAPIYDFQHDRYPSFECSVGCGGMMTGSNNITERPGGLSKISCDCDDDCDCFACVKHPKNRTTLDYVRFHNELSSRMSPGQDQFLSSSFVPNPCYDYQPSHEFGTKINHSSIAPTIPQTFSPQTKMNSEYKYSEFNWNNLQPSGNASLHMPTINMDQSRWSSSHVAPPSSTFMDLEYPVFENQQYSSITPSMVQSLVPSECIEPSHIHEPTQSLSLSALRDADSSYDDDNSTISPSSFLFQEFVLEQCDGDTGTCQCGDSCTCSGCLTHKGVEEEVLEIADPLESIPAAE